MQNLSIPIPFSSKILRGWWCQRPMLIIGFLMTFFTVSAQLNPVSGTLSITSPVPTTWSKFAVGTVTPPATYPLSLSLTLAASENGQQPIRLKLYIEKGNTLIARSADVIVSPFDLLGTMPFPSSQIAEYFQFTNLQGLSQSQYDAQLEEGLYRLTFEVYNATGETRLSAPISQSMFVTLNAPPTLSEPSNGEQVQSSATGINFRWSSEARKFTLVEVPSGTTDVAALFNVATPKFTETGTTATTSLSKTAAQLGLETGKTYAWRVQVVDPTQPTQSHPSYRNNGNSNIFTFAYTTGTPTCPPVTGLTLTAKASDVVAVSWTGLSQNYSYRVAYRKYSTNNDWQWIEVPTDNTSFNLTGLETSTAQNATTGIEYEVRVGGVCSDNSVGFCAPQRVTTLGPGKIDGLNCGAPEIPTPTGTGIATLGIGDVITAGDFLVTLTQVSGGSGSFSGKGWIKVPWMLGLKIAVTFNNIGVNTDKKLTNGTIETVYDPTWGNIVSLDGTQSNTSASIQYLVSLISDFTDKLNELLVLMQSGSQAAITAWLTANQSALTSNLNNLLGQLNLTTAEKDRIKGLLSTISSGQGNAATVQSLLDEMDKLAADVAASIEGTLPTEVTAISTPMQRRSSAPPPKNLDTWISPAGEPVRLPMGSKSVDFTYCYNGVEWALPNGILKGFQLPDGGKTYAAKILMEGSQQKFYGYYEYLEWKNTRKTTSAIRFAQSEVFTLAAFPNRKKEANVVRYTRDASLGKIVSSAVSTGDVVFVGLDNLNKLGASGKTCLSATAITNEEAVSTAQINTTCDYGTGLLADYITGDKLQKWLLGKGKTKGTILFSDCGASGKILYKVTSAGTTKITTDAESNTLKTNFDNGTIDDSKDYTLKVCITKEGKWDVKAKFKIPTPNSKLGGLTSAQVKEAIDGAIGRIQTASNNAGSSTPKYGFAPEPAKDANNLSMGEIYAESAGLVEVITEVVETGQSIVKDAKMPEKYWKKGADYDKAMLHLPSVVGGVGDGVIDQVTEKIQFVQMGLSVIENPGQIRDGWNSLGRLRFADVKNGIISSITEQVEEVRNGTDKGWHTVGKTGVELTTNPLTVVTTLKDIAGKGGKQLLKQMVIGKLQNLQNAKKWVDRLDDKLDEGLLKRVDGLDDNRLKRLDDIFRNQDLPGDRPIVNGVKLDANFIVSRPITINGQTTTVSINYDKNGFPDFTNIAKQYGGDKFVYKPNPNNHILTGKSGICSTCDMGKANAWATNQSRPGWTFIDKGNGQCEINDVLHTWHHHEDGLTMFPVPTNIHSKNAGGFAHSGGAAIINYDNPSLGLMTLFASPKF